MRYLDDKNSKEEEDHWIGLSDFERERFERHADFLIDQGYMAVDPHTLAVKVAWKLRHSPQPEGGRARATSDARSGRSSPCGRGGALTPPAISCCASEGQAGHRRASGRTQTNALSVNGISRS
jgi:hypothetical protein